MQAKADLTLSMERMTRLLDLDEESNRNLKRGLLARPEAQLHQMATPGRTAIHTSIPLGWMDRNPISGSNRTIMVGSSSCLREAGWKPQAEGSTCLITPLLRLVCI
jgi:hypothetical protein